MGVHINGFRCTCSHKKELKKEFKNNFSDHFNKELTRFVKLIFCFHEHVLVIQYLGPRWLFIYLFISDIYTGRSNWVFVGKGDFLFGGINFPLFSDEVAGFGNKKPAWNTKLSA